MRTVKAVLSTDGKGLWSEVAKDVKITGINLPYVDDEEEFGELIVIFDPKSWDVATDGLIYTDKKFLEQLKELLTRLGYEGQDIEYSEQGMQGDDYVSLDVGEAFIKSYSVEQLDDML